MQTENEFKEELRKVIQQTYVECPKHGHHSYVIESDVPGYEGVWCQLCWLESLGTPLKSGKESVPYYRVVD